MTWTGSLLSKITTLVYSIYNKITTRKHPERKCVKKKQFFCDSIETESAKRSGKWWTNLICRVSHLPSQSERALGDQGNKVDDGCNDNWINMQMICLLFSWGVFKKKQTTFYLMFLLIYSNTRESLGEPSCGITCYGLCSQHFSSPKLPLMFLKLSRKTEILQVNLLLTSISILKHPRKLSKKEKGTVDVTLDIY